jgi:hypothetical protein
MSGCKVVSSLIAGIDVSTFDLAWVVMPRLSRNPCQWFINKPFLLNVKRSANWLLMSPNERAVVAPQFGESAV